MKKILIIQSRQKPEMVAAEQGEYRRAVPSDVAIDFISSLDTTLQWEDPERMLALYGVVILGGSGEFDFDGGRPSDDVARITSYEIVTRLSTFVRYVLAHDFPLLGVCYGHQIIAEVLGTKVTHDCSQNKVGTFPVMRTKEGVSDPVFSHLPDTFMAQYGHKDSVCTLPYGAVLLASGERCKASALRFGSHVYTMQFHPELTEKDVLWKLSNSPGYLPEGISVESIIKPSPEASTIIPHFIQYSI